MLNVNFDVIRKLKFVQEYVSNFEKEEGIILF